MFSMDLKGITWVGHVYQKFEALCLEVEEIMYQDTVKYVEDQVQTVGSNVKNFYLDVIEDFLSPSSVDFVRGKGPSNLPAEQNTDVGICKKPKASIKEEAMKVDNEQSSEASIASVDLDSDADHGRSFHGFQIEDSSFQAASGDAIEGVCSDVYSKEYDARSGYDQSSLCMQKIRKEENFPPRETFGEIPHTERDLSGESSSCELLDKNQEASDDHVAVNPILVITQVASHKPIEEINDELENGSKGASSVLTRSLSTESCDEIENSSASSSCSDSSAELHDIRMSDGVVSLVGSFVNEDVQPSEFPDKIAFLYYPGLSDYSTMDTLQGSTVVDQGYETIQQVDNIQVEESCVLVNGDELRFFPCKEGKPRPYKKKIQDAISSKMISARKHEYKQLAMLYDEDVRSRQENAETKGSQSHGSRELEWELL